MGPAITNLPCSRYKNEMHTYARSGRAKRASLLVIFIHVATTVTCNDLVSATWHCTYTHMGLELILGSILKRLIIIVMTYNDYMWLLTTNV